MADRKDKAHEGECRGAADAEAMETTLALSGGPGCIAEARRRATAFLTLDTAGHRSGVSERIVSLTELVVSELVTNACKYAPGPILVCLRLFAEAVEVEVWDSHPALPAARRTDPARVGQHGLEIVKAVAADLAVLRETVGKRVIARILLEPGPAADGD
ncbi:ATP-binding protein [Streptomyces sp. NPDC096012]|uniref:ATP-binding protein n=1 Tax=Streptomyces sp. NPDC096012 TaxID=3155684 RepID=UPI00336A58C2